MLVLPKKLSLTVLWFQADTRAYGLSYSSKNIRNKLYLVKYNLLFKIKVLYTKNL